MRTAGELHYVTARPRTLRLVVSPLEGDRVRPLRARDALTLATSAVLNGPMFDKCDPRASYERQSCDRIAYALRSSTFNAPGRHEGAGCTLSVHGDVAGFGSPQDSADVVVQLAPCLVRGGASIRQASTSSNRETTWRAGVALLGDGALAFVVGRMPLQAFADAIARELHATDAGYTDGGGSTRLAEHGGAVGSSENRPVASWLAFVDAAGFEVSPGAQAQSGVTLGQVAGVGFAVGAGILAAREIRKRRRR